jgi:hypothetical protein
MMRIGKKSILLILLIKHFDLGHNVKNVMRIYTDDLTMTHRTVFITLHLLRS